jgi:hypothetical protein
VDLQCSDRDRLIEQYVAAVNAFGRAVGETGGRSDSRTVRELTQRTSESCQRALQAVLDHQREHGCGNSTSYAIKRLRTIPSRPHHALLQIRYDSACLLPRKEPDRLKIHLASGSEFTDGVSGSR